MDARTYLDALRRQWWVVLLLVAAGLGLGYARNAVATPVYSGHVGFFVSTPLQQGQTSDQFAQERAVSLADVVSSQQFAELVVRDTGVRLTTSQVENRLSGSVDFNTVILSVTVRDSQRARALVLASAVADHFGAFTAQLDGTTTTATGGSTPGATAGATAGTPAIVLHLVSAPTVGTAPISPKISTNLALGLLGGLAVGIGLVVARRFMDTSVRTAGDLEAVADIPVLAALPEDRRRRRQPVLAGGAETGDGAESFRKLRTSLRLPALSPYHRVLLVTSAVTGEGRTTTAANLAWILARGGRRVLLVDADLRSPRLASYLGIPAEPGLTDVLEGSATLAGVTARWEDVAVVPAGASSVGPAEALESPRFVALLQEAREEYDAIVIDSPPLVAVTDGATVARLVDSVLVVVRARRTTRADIATGLSALASVEAPVAGFVLNRAGRDAGSQTPTRAARTTEVPEVFSTRSPVDRRRPVPDVTAPADGSLAGSHAARRS